MNDSKLIAGSFCKRAALLSNHLVLDIKLKTLAAPENIQIWNISQAAGNDRKKVKTVSVKLHSSVFKNRD